ncbi:lysophospholipid acyltransferase 5, partial [Rhincodon typus]|uniref:lysophospholipid acyltransferase 5 n=1 Tax=Rhincodon typus TaxID=259920 RepID=UPI00202F3414
MAAVADSETGEVGWGLQAAAAQLGATEAALRLFISIVMGYPFALFHRQFLYGSKPHVIHFYNTALGLWIAYFNFGFQMFHSLICVLFQFLVLRLIGRTVIAVIISLLFQMSQLSKEQEQYCVPTKLSLLEVAGFVYFYGAFLVGPQFPVSNYLRLATGEMTDRPGHPPD